MVEFFGVNFSFFTDSVMTSPIGRMTLARTMPFYCYKVLAYRETEHEFVLVKCFLIVVCLGLVGAFFMLD